MFTGFAKGTLEAAFIIASFGACESLFYGFYARGIPQLPRCVGSLDFVPKLNFSISLGFDSWLR
jgi:hypothetical protein